MDMKTKTSKREFCLPNYLISLTGMEFYTYLGVNPEEKEKGQSIIIDLELACEYLPGIESDDLKQTVNYSDVFNFVAQKATTATCDLIEYLAGEIAAGIFARFSPVTELSLAIKKPFAPLEGKFDHMSFRLTQTRAKFAGGRRKTAAELSISPVNFLHQVYIGLGSNMGDRKEHLITAIKRLKETPGLEMAKLSSLYETKAWGKEDQEDFFNAVALFHTSLEPLSVLDICQAIELERGRQRLEKWGPRSLDLDLISYDDLEIKSQRLVLPHPLYQQRDFVLIPLAEIKDQELKSSKTVRLVSSNWYPYS